jgi:hypothetical protein
VLLAGVVVFEFGARYGAANVRAYGIAGELALPLNLYVRGAERLHEQQRHNIAFIIDYRIAAGAVHRKTWYLGKKAEEALAKVLAYALSVRGDAAVRRFEPTPEDLAKVREQSGETGLAAFVTRMEELREAVAEAKKELVDEAPPPPGEEEPPAPPPVPGLEAPLAEPVGDG